MPAPLAEVVSDFKDVAGPGQAAASAGIRRRATAASRRPRGSGDGTGARVPVAAVPARRRRRPRPRPAVLQRAARGADHTRLRVDPCRGLDEQSADDILAVPDDFYTDLGLAALISPLRLRGMSAMLARIKRHLPAATTVRGVSQNGISPAVASVSYNTGEIPTHLCSSSSPAVSLLVVSRPHTDAHA